MTSARFITLVSTYYKEHGRHKLPWRKSHDPYRVLVSELMLQQTQVERVIPYFTTWMRTYPTIQSLAAAPLVDVLRLWQGLGYNRRAKLLHETAKVVTEEHKGKMPPTVEQLLQLPGVGPYTARAIAAFSYNQDVVFIETNIRTTIIHHFFTDRSDISDTEVMIVLEKVTAKALTHMNSREWYSALMDYGSYLKRSGIRTNARSKGYAKQSTFVGSGREVRGAILRTLSTTPATQKKLLTLFPEDRSDQITTQLERLMKEGLIQKERTTYSLPH